MFKNLATRITGVFDRLTSKGSITEHDLELAMREIRVALLEADVALPVARKLIEDIQTEALGEKVVKSVTPGQMVIKIVHDKLVELLGSAEEKLNLEGSKPRVFMMVGLQGAGKTTMAAKVAHLVRQEHSEHKILLASLDIYRPAAREQLAKLAEQVGCESLPIIADEKPEAITKRALKAAKEDGYDLLILDTAGRLHIDDYMMQEAKSVAKLATPDEILLVADSLTGQDAVNIATSFKEALDLTGIALTRVDADSRGGAALSLKAITGVPIKLIGVGEKIADVQEFFPERIASRILDKGDIVTLVEHASRNIDESEADNLLKRIESGKFDLNDFAAQLKTIKKLGGAASIMGMMPGMGKLKKLGADDLDEKIFDRQLAIYYSMTKQERRFPKIVDASRKKRIAKGAGVDVPEVNVLLKQFREMETMVKKLGKMGSNAGMLKQLGRLLG